MLDVLFQSGLFIIDGIITIPIALLGFLIMPGESYFYQFVSAVIDKRNKQISLQIPNLHSSIPRHRLSLHSVEWKKPDGSLLSHSHGRRQVALQAHS